MSKVILRHFNPETDGGIVRDCYPKAIWFGAAEKITEKKKKWFLRMDALMEYQFQEADIYIACFEDDHDYIHGFSIIDDGILDFVYVKPSSRNSGIATLLIKGKYEKINRQNLTKPGLAILAKHPELAGEENGERTETALESGNINRSTGPDQHGDSC